MEISLQLANAQGRWVKGENENQWQIVDKDGVELGFLPATFDEKDVMKAIRLGRDYELKAFNIGIQYGKEQAGKVADLHVKRLESDIASLTHFNQQLSEQLERQISGET